MFRATIGEYDSFLDLGEYHTDGAAYAAIGRHVTAHPGDANRYAKVINDDGETPARTWRMPEQPGPDVTVLYPVERSTYGAQRWDRSTEDPKMWLSSGNNVYYHWDEMLPEVGALTDREPVRVGLTPGLWTARLPIALGGRVEPGADIAAGEQIVLLEPGGGDTWHVMTTNGDRARAATRVLEGALLEGGAQS